MRRLIAALTTTLLPAAALGQSNRLSGYDIKTEVRQGEGPASEQLIYLTNRTGETIIVTSLQLVDCENIQGGCVTRKMNLRVFAGQEVMLRRVRPQWDDKPSNFRYRFTWKPEKEEESPPVRIAVNPATAVPASIDTVTIDTAKTEALVHRIEEAVKQDSVATSNVVDSVVVVPAVVTVHVGGVVDLATELAIHAQDAKGHQIAGVRMRLAIEAGREFAKISGATLTGLKAGSAVIRVAPPQPQGTTGGEPKGTSRVLVRVLP